MDEDEREEHDPIWDGVERREEKEEEELCRGRFERDDVEDEEEDEVDAVAEWRGGKMGLGGGGSWLVLACWEEKKALGSVGEERRKEEEREGKGRTSFNKRVSEI